MNSETLKHKITEAISTANPNKAARDKLNIVDLPENGLLAYLKSTLILDEQGNKDIPSPNELFFILDLGKVASLVRRWAQALPSVRPYYAVKCNPDAVLVSSLAALGVNFDCASKSEIELVLSLGVSPSRILYANPCKPKSHILYAKSVGVYLTTFDSIHEVDKLRRLHPECSLLLRIKAPDAGSEYPLGSKYGADPEEVVPLLVAAKSAHLPVLGVSFHVGSGSNNPESYKGGIAGARAAFDAAADVGLPPLSIVNIGGGFVSNTRFEDAAGAVYSALNLHFGAVWPGVEVIAEPGRYFAETVMTLVTSLIGKRRRGELREYWIGDGIYGALNCMNYEHGKVYPRVFAAMSNAGDPTCQGDETFPSVVFGPTCCAMDIVLKDFPLPELAVADWLVFPDMGSYTTALGSNFNGFITSDIPVRLVYSDDGVSVSFEELRCVRGLDRALMKRQIDHVLN